MADVSTCTDSAEPYGLNRFVQAQEADYEQALSEIRSGRERSHWMWYIFPQYDGLGSSATSRRYAIKSLAEAKAYLSHPVLGLRLLECAEAAIGLEARARRQHASFAERNMPGRAGLANLSRQSCFGGSITIHLFTHSICFRCDMSLTVAGLAEAVGVLAERPAGG